MKYLDSKQKSNFEVDFTRVLKMSPAEEVQYFKSLLNNILGEAPEELVTLNYGEKIYVLNGKNVPVFVQCFELYKHALEKVNQIKFVSPTCSIDWTKIKDYSLEEKISYFQSLIEKIEMAPIVIPFTFEEDGYTHIINKKDLGTYKACMRELKSCQIRHAILNNIEGKINGIKDKAYECKINALAFRDRIVCDAIQTKKKAEKLMKKIKDVKKKGRILLGTVKTSPLKKGAALVLSAGFIGNFALETFNDEVKINRALLLDLLPVKPIECVMDEESSKTRINELMEVYDFDSVSKLTPGQSLDKILNSGKVEVREEVREEIQAYLDSLGTPINIYVERRKALIDSYLEEYSLYFNLDKDKVIALARSVTNDYEEDFSSIIGDDIYDLSNDEVATLVFTYLLWRDKLAKSLDELGTSYEELTISDEVYGRDRDKGSEVILRNGETENQFMVRICKLLGIDEVYTLSVSLYESGRFQSHLCRNKNNYGGHRNKNGEFTTYPSSEAGIIAHVIIFKEYEKIYFSSLEKFCSYYVYGSRSAEPSKRWLRNVKSFHSQITKNYEEFTGYPKDQEIVKVPVITLY